MAFFRVSSSSPFWRDVSTAFICKSTHPQEVLNWFIPGYIRSSLTSLQAIGPRPRSARKRSLHRFYPSSHRIPATNLLSDRYDVSHKTGLVIVLEKKTSGITIHTTWDTNNRHETEGLGHMPPQLPARNIMHSDPSYCQPSSYNTISAPWHQPRHRTKGRRAMTPAT